jgi:hypothetical protein
MRKGRILDAVRAAMGSSDTMTLDELKAVVFSTYTEPELMRRGSYYTGKKSLLQSRYIAGQDVDDSCRIKLVRLGIAKVVMDLLRKRANNFVLDKQSGVVSRVRK